MTATATTTRAAETWAHMLAAARANDPLAVPVALDFAQEGVELAEACAAVEAVAQAHLDAQPGDHAARRVLGEWLTACGDERGEGYRTLGVHDYRPFASMRCVFVWFNGAFYGRDQCSPNHLPGDWYAWLGRLAVNYSDWPTRRAAEDAAARAFLRLPPSRRAQLLKGEM